jgi:threonine dehydrogenase-like Zn-dependent dehydrogenase
VARQTSCTSGGSSGLATHHLPLDEAPHGYETFQKKGDDCIKVVLQPGA